jgi:hypothetical protein
VGRVEPKNKVVFIVTVLLLKYSYA